MTTRNPTQTSRIPVRRWLARCMLAVAVTAACVAVAPHAQAGVFVSVNIAPPVLPVYVQPPIPGPGYIWTPGYWAYDEDGGYYWVPGTWVLPPYSGALWTPGWWGWGGGAYVFHPGYWGYHVGYYGGINYGFGYVGIGYVGGYWGSGGFYYNRTVNNITNVTNVNVYNRTINNTTVNNVSYNGPGGITRQPTAQENAYAQEAHTAPVAAQVQHQTLASQNQSLRASVNHGTPAIAATARPAVFNSATVSATRTAAVAAPATHAAPVNASASHATTRNTQAASVRSTNYPPHAVQNNRANTASTTAGAAPASRANALTSAHAPTTHTQNTAGYRAPSQNQVPRAAPQANYRSLAQHAAANPHPAPAPHSAPAPHPAGHEDHHDHH